MFYPECYQYILWKYEPNPPKKDAKVPCDADGKRINPHDPIHWMPEATARDAAERHGFHVGFVLNKNADPYFCIDLDGVRDPVTTHVIDPEADALLKEFPGASIEVSVSGTGFHIWGSAQQNLLEDRRNKWGDGKFEFYFHDRFIALGEPLHGSFGHDFTETILRVVPQRPQEETGEIIAGSGRAPEWDGPEDDDELLKIGFNMRSIATMFGDKASFIDLWHGNAEALGRHYGSDTDDFDRSRAEAALAAHLAFLTGRDISRMHRLFLASPLAQSRPEKDRKKKFGRDSYMRETLVGAAHKTPNVYQNPKNRPARSDVPTYDGPLLPGMEAHVAVPEASQPPDDPVLPGMGQVASEAAAQARSFMTIFDMQRHFAGCTYIEETNEILCPDGVCLDRDRFKIRYGGYQFQMQADGAKPTYDAWEAYTLNRAFTFWRAKFKRFDPHTDFGHIADDAVNVFRKPVVTYGTGEVDPYLDLVGKLMPDQRDQQIFLTWCAAMVQNPGAKFQWAVVLQGTEGNGKTFLLRCLANAVGMSVSHFPNPEDLGEKYNDYLEGNLLIGVEEVHMAGRRDVLDRLKKYITNDRIEIRSMRANKRMTDNLTNWMFLTNYKDAVIKSRNDRRYSIFFTAQQTADDLDRDGMTGSYFPELWNWARSGGFANVAGWFSMIDLVAEFDPSATCHRAPETSSTDAAIEHSLGGYEQEIREAVEQGEQGFRGGWISSFKATQLLKKAGYRVGPRTVGSSIENLGYEKYGRAPIIFEEDRSRPVLYCRPELRMQKFTHVHYKTAQGYDLPSIKPVL